MEQKVIGVIGLGYVGLPLAIEFAKKYPVIGFDINQRRVSSLLAGNDYTLEVSNEDLKSVLRDATAKGNGILITSELDQLKAANIYIITVPTPVDKYNRPDLTPLYKASDTVGKVLK